MGRFIFNKPFPVLTALSIAIAFPVHSAPLGYFETEEKQATTPYYGNSPTAPFFPLAAIDPEKALEEIERRLYENADFQSVLASADMLEQRLPNSHTAQWLLALALAADGQTDKAIAKLEAVEKTFPNDVLSAPALLAKAMVARRSGEFEQAQALIVKAIVAAPQNPYAHNMAGMVATARGDLGGAARSFSTAARLAPEAQTYQLNLGVTELNRGSANTAEAALSAALDLTPGDCRVLTAFAQLRDRQLRLSEATEYLKTCLASDATAQGRAAYLVDLLTRQNLLDEAIDVAKESQSHIENGTGLLAELYLKADRPADAKRTLTDAQDNAVLVMQRSITASLEGHTAEALEIARAIAPEAVNNRTRLTTLGLSVAAGENFDNADFKDLTDDPVLAPVAAYFMLLNSLSKGDKPAIAAQIAASQSFLPGIRYDGLGEGEWLSLSGSAAISALAKGTLYHLRDLPVPARRELTAAQELSPEAAFPAYLGAVVAHGMGDRKASIKDLETALQNQPDFYAANLLMAEVMIGDGQVERAVSYYDKATQVVADVGALIKLGVFADATNEVDLSERAFRAAIELQPNWFATYNQLAWVFIQREIRLDEAKILAEKANDLQPGNAAVLDNLGWIAFLQGDIETAVATLRRANEISLGRNYDILLHLALAENANGETELARTYAAELLKIADVSAPQAVKAKELLVEIATQ